MFLVATWLTGSIPVFPKGVVGGTSGLGRKQSVTFMTLAGGKIFHSSSPYFYGVQAITYAISKHLQGLVVQAAFTLAPCHRRLYAAVSKSITQSLTRSLLFKRIVVPPFLGIAYLSAGII